MLNCTATCRGADKKPRDNKLNVPSVTGNLALTKEVSPVTNDYSGIANIVSVYGKTAKMACQSQKLANVANSTTRLIKTVTGE